MKILTGFFASAIFCFYSVQASEDDVESPQEAANIISINELAAQIQANTDAIAELENSGPRALAWLNSLKRDFRIVADMSPSPANNLITTFTNATSQTTTQLRYRQVTGALVYTSTATTTSGTGTGNITISGENTGLILTKYDKATSVPYTTTYLTNSSGNTIYYTNDKYWNMQWWTDCEVKVVDKWGNIIYWATTARRNSSEFQYNHPEVADTNYTVNVYTNYFYQNDGCVSRKWNFTLYNTKAISNYVGYYYYVSNIEITPNFNSSSLLNQIDRPKIPKYTAYQMWSEYYPDTMTWGEYVRMVFTNPENSILYWRQNASYTEQYNYNKVWKRAQLEYYGDYKL